MKAKVMRALNIARPLPTKNGPAFPRFESGPPNAKTDNASIDYQNSSPRPAPKPANRHIPSIIGGNAAKKD